MFLKIIIIASVLILGVFVFSETSGVFPNSDVFDFVKENANTLEAKTTESVETGIGFVKTMDETGSKINNQINTVKESSKNLSKKISEINPLKKVEDVFTNNPTDEPTSTTSANQSNKDPIIKFDYSGSPIYENLSLSMIQQSNVLNRKATGFARQSIQQKYLYSLKFQPLPEQYAHTSRRSRA